MFYSGIYLFGCVKLLRVSDSVWTEFAPGDWRQGRKYGMLRSIMAFLNIGPNTGVRGGVKAGGGAREGRAGSGGVSYCTRELRACYVPLRRGAEFLSI